MAEWGMAETCAAEIERRGVLDPCSRPAVGMRPDEEGPWPACAGHMPPARYHGDGLWTGS